MKTPIVSLLTLISAATAWLPHERNFDGHVKSTTGYLPAGKGRFIPRSLPGVNKIRGVNLGSLFIIEPWMLENEWNSIGCGGLEAEFECVQRIGQNAADAAFTNHWGTWITEADLDKIKAYGLNTVRIPVGFWIIEDLVWRDSEYFPKGGLAYLDRVAGWAADRDIYVILDLHAAPGVQAKNQQFAGQFKDEPGFFESYQYSRAYTFLSTMTTRIHQNPSYRTTGMLEVLNEPATNPNHPTLVSEYYPNAYDAIRTAESNLNIPEDQRLTVQFMDSAWGAGNPKPDLGDRSGVAYDNHRYLRWDVSVDASKENYIEQSCHKDSFGRDENTPVIVGEWSLAVNQDVDNQQEWDPKREENKEFYRRWWAAQTVAYERELGWVFWSWKVEGQVDVRWTYSGLVEAGIIPENVDEAAGLAGC